MTLCADYFRAIKTGNDSAAARIEQQHGLFGYPPELVSVGLQAIDNGGNADAAIADYVNSDGDKTP